VVFAVVNITVEEYGDPLTLPCSGSSNVDIKWTQTDTSDTSSSRIYDIYSDDAIFEGLQNRFSIKSTIPLQHDLVMLRPNPSDAGLYECDERSMDDESRTVLSRYNVIVRGNAVVLTSSLYISLSAFAFPLKL